jgi:hypothetical protein
MPKLRRLRKTFKIPNPVLIEYKKLQFVEFPRVVGTVFELTEFVKRKVEGLQRWEDAHSRERAKVVMA